MAECDGAGIDPRFDEWRELASTGSTNEDLLSAARTGAITGPCLLAAAQQTAGRGRLGRGWRGAERALAFSIAYPLQRPPLQWDGLSLAVGLALLQTLLAHQPESGWPSAAPPWRLKWPNDILDSQGAKLVGILLESTLQPRPVVVVGVGLNLALSALDREHLAAQGRVACDLLQAGLDWSAPQALRVLAPAVLTALSTFDQHGFAPLQAAFDAAHAYTGVAVDLVDTMVSPARVLAQGRVLGVSERGELILDGADGQRQFRSGELSLRSPGQIASKPS